MIADRHPILQDGLELWLRRLDPGIEIVKSPGLAGVSEARDAVPDVLLCDIASPDGRPEDALAALRAVHNRLPDTTIIVFTALRDSQCVSGALEAGARGYIPKTHDGESLLSAIRLVLSGGVYVPPDLFQPATELSDTVSQPAARPEMPKLTPRQRNVLEMLSRGYSNREIARRLGISEGTIKIHVAAIFKAFGVSNRTQAVIAASGYGPALGPQDEGTDRPAD